VHASMTIENPKNIPMLNGNDFLKPRRLALDMDIILFGPGVIAVMIAYVRKLIQLNILIASFKR
jgi:hypothetical protein